MAQIKIATFNVENLFERPKVFNFKDHSVGNEIMGKIQELREILKEANYTENRKTKILSLYSELKDYIIIREDRGKLFKKQGWKVVGIKARGSGDWDGSIGFKKAKFSDMARENTAHVIKTVKPDIACVIEADNRISLKRFDSHLLNARFKYEMLIDGNDSRGIDVGILSKYVFGNINTHIYDHTSNKRVFSRDCLEIEVKLSDERSLFLLINHFKSKGYDYENSSSQKRKRQATRVTEILKNYDLEKDFVVVAGDLNDTPDSLSLRPLLSMSYLHDVLSLQFGNDMSQRWTYHYKKFEQIDYILVSEPLKRAFVEAGVERRGMHNLRKLTSDTEGQVIQEVQFDSVTHKTNQASDHGAVWALFDIEI